MPQSHAEPPRQGVVAVVIRDGRFLVIRRSQHVRAPLMHCFPGGAIEPGEGEAAAVCRELREELAVDAAPQRLLWRSTTQSAPTSGGETRTVEPALICRI